MLDEGTVRVVVESAVGVAASFFGWSMKREVTRHDSDMAELKKNVATLQETTVKQTELERLADDIKDLLRDHADTSAKTLARIEARVDQLFQRPSGK